MAATRRYHDCNLFRFRYLLQWDRCASRAMQRENKRLITQNCYAKWLNVNLWEANLNLELVEMGHQQRWDIIAAHQSNAICHVWLHSNSTPPRLCSRTVSLWSASRILARFGSNEWKTLFEKRKSIISVLLKDLLTSQTFYRIETDQKNKFRFFIRTEDYSRLFSLFLRFYLVLRND